MLKLFRPSLGSILNQFHTVDAKLGKLLDHLHTQREKNARTRALLDAHDEHLTATQAHAAAVQGRIRDLCSL